MKIYIKSLFFICLLTLQTTAMDAVGIINDEFFTHPDTIVTFRSLIPHQDSYMAIIDGTTKTENRTKSLVPFFTRTWEHDDVALASHPRIDSTVLCGTRTLTKNLISPQTFPFLFLREIEDKTGELIMGGRVTYYKIREYRRHGDESLFRQQGVPIYDLGLTEERVGGPDVAVCTKEWNITSKWERKTRHRRTHYTSMDVYRITTKYPAPVGLMLAAPTPEEMSRVKVKTELRFKCLEEESPECGNNGGNLPPGAVLL